MLSARTKQVFAYGRRGQRIVNVVERNESDAFHSPVKTVRNPAASRHVQTENVMYLSPSPPRHRAHGKSKRAHISPTKSPLGPPKRKAQVKLAARPKKKTVLSKFEEQTPVRQPLTPLHTNGASPMALPPSALARKKGKAPVQSPPRAALKPTSPIVTLDIIILDDDGKKLSQERRVSRTDVRTNSVTGAAPRVGGKGAPKNSATIPISDSDYDLEEVPEVAKKRQGRVRSVIIISSDDDEPPPRCKIEPTPTFSKRQSSFLEVLIPPAPYKLPTPHKLPTIPNKLLPPPPPLHQPQAPVFVPLAPPITKVRQLTPIRRGQNQVPFQRFFPTPSTPTDADLSLELEQLNISDVTEFEDLSPSQPDYLVPLLSECSQTCPHEFSAFIETFPFDPIVQPAEGDDLDIKFRKIGEASFSEVFGIGDVVLKIIPLRDEEQRATFDLETPAPSDANDVLKEVIVTRAMGEMGSGFVKLLRTYVVRGRYPSLLLDLWDEYNKRKGSEGIRPDSFGLAQVYAIIVLPNGGPDLEAFTFKNAARSGWHQACSIFWQIARALEQAEELMAFEHRDLHWGQILVKNVPVRNSLSKKAGRKLRMDDVRFGVKATIIDLGLSRMETTDGQGSKTYWTPFDEEIFDGEGDYQFDVYRMMKEYNGHSWEGYQPFTNVMWLHYLTQKLLYSKRLKPPAMRKKSTAEPTQMASLTGYDEQECYDSLVEIDKLLGGCITAAKKGRKGKRKMCVPSSCPRTAGDIVLYGVQKGWMKP
ncbi:hypothetical protein DEU56DRAFT_227193 [Suillus clintonianus]|uniref:uncharacterized protein n=1 Tax=Suillus clintonianus TaxID=1904413 RepID=UPI001B8602F8|nr:uncharacterized protein DEU56DRAFT_227193 [Suillus clintonianus]KAG2156264.1 hypothetical protein DEU56DRAFT_227193 [Suillus clintonianus]